LRIKFLGGLVCAAALVCGCGGSGTGALIGGVAAGPVGLLVGAGTGGFFGSIGEAITGKKNLHLPVETPLAFTLRAGVSVDI